MNNQRQKSSDVEKMANAIHVLNTAPAGLVLTAADKDIVYAALLAFDHEWTADRWCTPFGDVHTMAQLRQVRDRISRGETSAR